MKSIFRKIYIFLLVFQGFSARSAYEWCKKKSKYEKNICKIYKRYMALNPVSGKYNSLAADRLSLQYIFHDSCDYILPCRFQVIKRNGYFRLFELDGSKSKLVGISRVIEVLKTLGSLSVLSAMDCKINEADVMEYKENVFYINQKEFSLDEVYNFIVNIKDTYVITDTAEVLATAIVINECGSNPHVILTHSKEITTSHMKMIDSISRKIAISLQEVELFGIFITLVGNEVKVVSLDTHPDLPYELINTEVIKNFINKKYENKQKSLTIKKRCFFVAKAIYILIAEKKGYMGFMMKNWQRDIIKDWFFNGTSVKEKIWAHRRGFLSFRIAQYNLTGANYRSFLSDRDYRKLRPLNNAFVVWVYDKVISRYILDGKKHFMAKYYFHLIYRDSKQLVLPSCDLSEHYNCSIDGIIEVLKLKKKLIVKPSEGSHGDNITRLEFLNGAYYINKEKVFIDDLKTRLRTLKGNFNITEYIEMHSFFRRIYNGATYTIRVMVINRSGTDPWIANAYVRIATLETGVTDNISDGGICARIDLETGVLYEPERIINHIIYSCKVHPDTGVEIKGVVPHWDKVKRGIEDISKYIFQLEYMGFDVVVTDDSFKILEINTHQDLHRYPHYDRRIHEYFLGKR